MLLSEKRCHSLFIRFFTEPDREEVHSQTMKVINEFKLTVVHFARPNPPALCRRWAVRGPAFSKTQSSSRLEDRGLFRSANILEIANVVLLVVFFLFLLCS